jgi:hypothetical protein
MIECVMLATHIIVCSKSPDFVRPTPQIAAAIMASHPIEIPRAVSLEYGWDDGWNGPYVVETYGNSSDGPFGPFARYDQTRRELGNDGRSYGRSLNRSYNRNVHTSRRR